jgi:glycosyltransferase involved in cell wall biosynthesis
MTTFRKVVSYVRLLYVITRSEIGGAQRHVLDLLNHFRHLYEIALVVGDEGYLAKEARTLGIKVWICKNLVQPIHLLEDIRAFVGVRTILKLFKPDLVHAHSTKAGFVARIAAKLEGIPSVFTAHGWAFTEGTSNLNRIISAPIEWLLAKITYHIICVSEYDRKLGIHFTMKNRNYITTIHNGVEDILFKPNINENGVTIVMVARFSPPKDFKSLIEALPNLSDCRLRLVGDGPLLEEAKHLTEELKITHRVDFLGLRSDITDILASSDIFALISHYEGFPISILEAMRAALPVVASNVGGISESVLHNETGFLIDRRDSSNLEISLAKLVADPQLRQKLGDAGRARYSKFFTLDTMIYKTRIIYERALQKRNQSTKN